MKLTVPSGYFARLASCQESPANGRIMQMVLADGAAPATRIVQSKYGGFLFPNGHCSQARKKGNGQKLESFAIIMFL